jgi:UDPglucose 6-dehydrogenase
VTSNQAPIHVVTFESAEVAKISCNTFLTTKISYANLIAQIAARLPGAVTNQIFKVLNSDERIGNNFFNPGLGYGGPCLPRDNQALSQILDNLNIVCQIPSATHNFNSSHADLLIESTRQNLVLPVSRILILGISYKPGTSSTMESHALSVAAKFYSADCNVIAHDFLVDFNSSEFSFFEKATNLLTSDLLSNVSHIFISHPIPEYYDFIEKFAPDNVEVIDPWAKFV